MVDADPHLIPFWLSNTMVDESIMFIGRDTSAAGHLLFEPETLLSVTDAAGDAGYTEGRDFQLDRAMRRIVRLPGSRIPYMTRDAVTAAAGTLTLASTIAVTYTHSMQPAWRPVPSRQSLQRVPQLLRDKQPITVCITGDSISEGYDASGFHGLAPRQPAYPTLLASALRQQYGAPVTLHNFATAGWTAADGLWDVARVCAADPDLVIVAYGMNDASYADADEFATNISRLIESVRVARPRAEVVLVSPMLPTPACTWVVPGRFEQYRSSLMTLTREGVSLADVTSVWRTLIARKDPYDVSGNGLNHPNDFGHRVYAQTILACLSA